MKHSAEFNAFDALVRQVMAVPKAELVKREEEYQFHSALNPKRRGPKSKRKPVGPDPAAKLPS